MREMLISYAISFVMDILRDMAKNTSTTIDDQVVETINENMEELKKLIRERV